MVVSVDGLLERLGSRYQLLVFLLLGSCLMHVALNHHLHHSYLATPPHHCKIPEGWSDSLSLPTSMVRSSQRTQGVRTPPTVTYSSCEMFKDPFAHHKGTKPCVYGYVFSLRGTEWTIVAEWGLVCDRVWIKRWVTTSYLFGLVVGGLIFGFLADRFGRRNLLVVSVATVGCLGMALHFVRRLIVFLTLRFIQSIFVQGVYVTSWTLSGELFPPKWRCRALVAASMARPLGVAMGALTALFVQHWRAIQLAVSLPLLISLIYCWMVPESMRWLLARGKTRRARQVAAQLARHNLLVLPPTAHAQMDHLAAHVYQDVPWGSLATLFKTPRLRRHTFVVAIMWLSVSIADSGFRSDLPSFDRSGRLSSVLGGPGHLGSVLGAGVEAGAVVLAAVFTTQLYRRAFLVIQLLVAAALALGVTSVLQLLHDQWVDVDALATALRFLGVLVMGGARVGMGVVTVEVVPTIARASAVGLCAAHAALGEMLAPLFAIVAEITYPSVPWVASAIGCLVAALLALVLPETSGTSLPDVVEEAEVIGLWFRGEVIKSCDSAYGRSPFWVEVDGLIVSRSVSDSGPDDDDRFTSLERNFESQLISELPKMSRKMSNIGHGAGPSQLIALPHVHPRRKAKRTDSIRSSDSLPSSCSIVSLVDVSKINGNNSDTTDSNYSADSNNLGPSKRMAAEIDEISTNDKNPERRTNVKTSDKRVCKGNVRTEANSSSDPGEFSASGHHSSDSIENDVSISVCSLKFKHIRRPVSPTDERLRSKKNSMITRTCSERGESKTLIEEYISRNLYSSKEDVSSTTTSTYTERSTSDPPGTNRSQVTSPSAVLHECLRVARNKENQSKAKTEGNIPRTPSRLRQRESDLVKLTDLSRSPTNDVNRSPPKSRETGNMILSTESQAVSTTFLKNKIEDPPPGRKCRSPLEKSPSQRREEETLTIEGSICGSDEGKQSEGACPHSGIKEHLDKRNPVNVARENYVFRKAVVMTDLDETNL